MARVVVNLPENIVFANSDFAENTPTLSLQSGVWGDDVQAEAGIVFEVYGEAPPLLSTHDVKKLIRWLTQAVEALDGNTKNGKKQKHRHHYGDDDDEADFLNWKK